MLIVELIEEIKVHPLSGNDYFSCIQCGRCVGSCPAAKVSENNFNIRIMNLRIMDDDRSLLEDEAIWDCFYCQTCVNLCPKNNLDGYKTILILRDLALEKGHGIQYMKNLIPIMKTFQEKGVLTDGEGWMDAEALEEVKQILEISGLNEKLRDLEKKYSKKQNKGE